jgi:acyl-CoA thioesterase
MNLTPQQIVQKMLEKDAFSDWLGLEIKEIDEGYCCLTYLVRAEMLNGFGSIHGGVLFSAADSAFAFACNTNGYITVALNVSISFTKPAQKGERLWVEAKQIHFSNKIGIFDIITTNEQKEIIAIFKGTAYKTGKKIQN